VLRSISIIAGFPGDSRLCQDDERRSIGPATPARLAKANEGTVSRVERHVALMDGVTPTWRSIRRSGLRVEGQQSVALHARQPGQVHSTIVGDEQRMI
jgi:hypothetical protein